MQHYDFVITNLINTGEQWLATVEKVQPLDDDRLLDKWLADRGIADKIIGQTIEKLENLPFAHKRVEIGERIVINQI